MAVPIVGGPSLGRIQPIESEPSERIAPGEQPAPLDAYDGRVSGARNELLAETRPLARTGSDPEFPPQEHLGLRTPAGRFSAQDIRAEFAREVTEARIRANQMDLPAFLEHAHAKFERVPELYADVIAHFGINNPEFLADALSKLEGAGALKLEINYSANGEQRKTTSEAIFNEFARQSGELHREELTLSPDDAAQRLTNGGLAALGEESLNRLAQTVGAPPAALSALIRGDRAALSSTPPMLLAGDGSYQSVAQIESRIATVAHPELRARTSKDLERILVRAWKKEGSRKYEGWVPSDVPELGPVATEYRTSSRELVRAIAEGPLEPSKRAPLPPRAQLLEELVSANRLLRGAGQPQDRARAVRWAAQSLGVAETQLKAFLSDALNQLPARQERHTFQAALAPQTDAATREDLAYLAPGLMKDAEQFGNRKVTAEHLRGVLCNARGFTIWLDPSEAETLRAKLFPTQDDPPQAQSLALLSHAAEDIRAWDAPPDSVEELARANAPERAPAWEPVEGEAVPAGEPQKAAPKPPPRVPANLADLDGIIQAADALEGGNATANILRDLRDGGGIHERKRQLLNDKGGTQTEDDNYNIRIQGPSGTLKTTQVKLYARGLHALGKLASPDVAIPDMNEIVKKYDGHTQDAVATYLAEHEGQLILLDDIHQYLEQGDNTSGKGFSKVAIDCFFNAALGSKHTLGIATYDEKMDGVLGYDAGMAGRFPIAAQTHAFTDADFSTAIDRFAGDLGHTVGRKAKDRLMDELRLRRTQNGFGNARDVDFLLREAIRNQEARLSREGALEGEPTDALLTLKPEDIPGDERPEPTQAMEQISKMVGNARAKDIMFEQLAAIEAARPLPGEDANVLADKRKSVSSFFFFTGPSGAGKTMLANLVGKMFHAGGYLPSAKVHVINGAEFGPTSYDSASRLLKSLKVGLGRTVLVDEGYGLSSDAKAALMQFASENEGNVALIVAGYPDEIRNAYYRGNGGFLRRTIRVPFDELSPEDAATLLHDKLAEAGSRLDADAQSALPQVLERLRSAPEWKNGGDVEKFQKATQRRAAVRWLQDKSQDRQVITSSDLEEALERIIEDKLFAIDERPAQRVPAGWEER